MARRRKTALAEAAAEDLFEILVVVPSWVGPVLAVVAFTVLWSIVPAFFPPTSHSYKAVIGTWSHTIAPFVGLIILVLWAVAEIRKRHRRKLLDDQEGLASMRDLSWQEFEHLVGEAYRRKGYVVEERGGNQADGGVDLVAHKDAETLLVQCKHWKAIKVGVKPVRELFGVMTAEKAEHAVLATAGRFTNDAQAFADSKPIELLNGDRLWGMIKEVKQDARVAIQPARELIPSAQPTEVAAVVECPKCGSPMVERVARKGQHAGKRFWGCSKYPACRGIREVE